MKAEELMKKYNMSPHEENGKYCECHFQYDGEGRASSGSTVFYVAPNEKTAFHKIDCDEYWCFNAGANLEVWIIDETGVLIKKEFGITGDALPLVYFKKGVIFASKHKDVSDEGTFFTCITVPRFDYSGFELVDYNKLCQLYPDLKDF